MRHHRPAGAASACATFLLALGACTSAKNYAPVEYASGLTRPAGSPAELPPVATYDPARRQDTTYAPEQTTRLSDLTVRTVEPAQITPVADGPQRRTALRPIEPRPIEPRPIPAVDRREEAFSPPIGYVRVEPGDTVYALARKTGATPEEIIRANDMRVPYALAVGQFIRIPGGRPASVASSSQSLPTAPARVASVSNRSSGSHTVRRGDTLYSIATDAGFSVDEVARANGLRAPYTLAVGQQLRLPGGASIDHREADIPPVRLVQASERREIAAPAPAPVRSSAPAPARSSAPATTSARASKSAPASANSALAGAFDWPVRGPVLSEYGVQPSGRRNDGINISAPAGTPVRAAASGTVIYKGSELEGYGNLILIKHAGGWVTAYAHADQIIVNKGDEVERGQIIGKVGQTGSVNRPQLHFELRKELKAIDPRTALGSA